MRTAGLPFNVTFELPAVNWHSPINDPEIKPPATPGSSPLLIDIFESKFNVGQPQTSTCVTVGIAIIVIAILT
jgi:hypothetical protein